MRLGVNVPNFGPGTNPDVLRRWALTVEGLGFDLLMVPYRHPLLKPALMPRIALRLTTAPITDGSRLAGHGTIEQIAGDLSQLCSLGAGTVVLDPFNGDHRETAHPQTAWRALAAVAELWTRQEAHDIDPERS